MKLADAITLPRLLLFLFLVVIIYAIAVLDQQTHLGFITGQAIWGNFNNFLGRSQWKLAEASTVEPEEEANAKPKPKYMLFWTMLFRDASARLFIEVNDFSYQYTSTRDEPCILTTSRNMTSIASAVIFHSCDFYPRSIVDKTIPSVRHPWQRWIFFQLEAASNPNCATPERVKKYENYIIYNWTMTYQLSADVYFPYGMMQQRNKPITGKARQKVEDQIANAASGFSKRPFDAIWIVSNCASQSDRERLYLQLAKLGLKIEEWGECGRGSPDKAWQRNGGIDSFFKQFRFYFSFENSLCDDYITEKAYAGYFHNINHGLIPVMYGAGNYSAIFPPGSFINAYEMRPSEIVKLIREISSWDKNKLASSPYFTWQFTHQHDYKTRADGYYIYGYNLKLGLQSLCDRLWTAERNREPPKTITDLTADLGNCYPAPSFEQ